MGVWLLARPTHFPTTLSTTLVSKLFTLLWMATPRWLSSAAKLSELGSSMWKNIAHDVFARKQK